MLVIGELINTSRRIIMENVEKRNAGFFQDIAKRQVDAGADYLDINCGNTLDAEPEIMKWLIENVQSAVQVPLCIDTPNPVAMDIGLSTARNGRPIANSITGEKERYDAILPLILKYKPKVIVLCMDENGIPQTANEKLRVGWDLVKKLTASGIARDDIYLDLLVQPLATDDRAGLEVLNAISLFKQQSPEIHLISALSNISFGLPNRKVLNRIFMVQTLTMGMDAYILDPLDKEMIGTLYAAQSLLGQDKYCTKYLSAHRKGLYEK